MNRSEEVGELIRYFQPLAAPSNAAPPVAFEAISEGLPR